MKTLCLGLSLALNLLLCLWIFASVEAQRTDTAYASGFSEEAFRLITCKASRAEVERRIGKPLYEIQRSADGRTIRRASVDPNARRPERTEPTPSGGEPAAETYWIYSEAGPSSGNYRLRGITFDSDGRVMTLTAEDYRD